MSIVKIRGWYDDGVRDGGLGDQEPLDRRAVRPRRTYFAERKFLVLELAEELRAVTGSTYDGKEKVPADAKILGHVTLVHEEEEVGVPRGRFGV